MLRKSLVLNLGIRRPLGRPEGKYENNVEINIIGTECEDVDWTEEAPMESTVDSICA
jgi:hypothetical protein